MEKILNKIFGKGKSKKETPTSTIVEVESSMKKKSSKESSQKSVMYHGSTGSASPSNFGTGGISPYWGVTGSVDYYTKKPSQSVSTSGSGGFMGSTKVESYIIEDDIPFFNHPKDSFSGYPVVMLHTTEWIKRDFLIPIGKSKYTGYPIYRYLGSGIIPLKNLNHSYEELIDLENI